jgi:hypothetical protein
VNRRPRSVRSDACAPKTRSCRKAPAGKVPSRSPRPTTGPRCASGRRWRCSSPTWRILKLDRLRLRGSCGAPDEVLLGSNAQNLRKLARLIPAPAPLVPRQSGGGAARASSGRPASVARTRLLQHNRRKADHPRQRAGPLGGQPPRFPPRRPWSLPPNPGARCSQAPAARPPALRAYPRQVPSDPRCRRLDRVFAAATHRAVAAQADHPHA